MHSRQPTSLVISRHYCYKKFIHLNDDSLRIFENRMCFTVQLSRLFRCHFFATACLFYLISFCLSRTFLSFFKTFLMKFFIFIDDFSTLPQVESFVNHFFDFFKFKILKNQKRRRRDLNPRAALTTYTLSRGTSSAS